MNTLCAMSTFVVKTQTCRSKIRGHFSSGLIAQFGFLLESFESDAIELGCDAFVYGGGRGGVEVNDLGANLDQTAAGEGRLSSQAFIEECTEGKQIAACIYAPACGLFRRQIHGSANDHITTGAGSQKGIRIWT